MADTIFALSSGRPPAAIAVIRITGASSHRAGELIAGSLPLVRETAVRTLRDPSSNALLDEALVLRFDGPASATGEDVIELHCHGGRAVVDAVLSALRTIEGLREAIPGEFTRRAFENGRIDLTEAEGLADLLEAETEGQRRAALQLAEGGLRRQIEQWQGRVLDLAAQAELLIEYADENDQQADDSLAREAGELAEELGEWLKRPRAEALKEGVRVVAAGPPNAGKSSLINAIARKDQIIVSAVPGTTRDLIEVPLAIGGLPFLFVDTAGLRETEDVVEAVGIGLAEAAVGQADILLWLGDPVCAPTHPRCLLVHSKCDLNEQVPAGSIGVSAVTGQGLRELLDYIVAEASKLLPATDAIALNRRQASIIDEAQAALSAAAEANDPVLQAEDLRAARLCFDRLSGRAGVEDLLDSLFNRFCLGK